MRRRLIAAWRRLPHPLRWLGVACVGGTLIVVGVVFLVLPGPGIPLVILGLVVLATEFAWAEVILGHLRRRSSQAMAKARQRLQRGGQTAEG